MFFVYPSFEKGWVSQYIKREESITVNGSSEAKLNWGKVS